MNSHECRFMFLSVGLTEDQIDTLLDRFLALGDASKITSLSDCETATAIYAVMDGYLHPGDLYSPAARYQSEFVQRAGTENLTASQYLHYL